MENNQPREIKTIHMSVDIEGLKNFLRQHDNKEEKVYSIGGKFIDSGKAIKNLTDLQISGLRYLPMGKCNHMAKDGHCLGHLKIQKKADQK